MGLHTFLESLDYLLNKEKLEGHDIDVRVARKLSLFKVKKILLLHKNLLNIYEQSLRRYYTQTSNLIYSIQSRFIVFMILAS
jgi:hypothetical protein